MLFMLTIFVVLTVAAKLKKLRPFGLIAAAPVLGEDSRRKWQEFYHCQCDRVLVAWSSDRPAENK
jgi:ABC-type spermidine/putrescine transport system permease subunit I